MLFKALITEKTVSDMANDRYAFRVSLGVTKTEIKKQIEKMFGVNVIKVHTANMPGKTYRSGKRWMIRQKTDWKKAIVTLKSGQKIDLVDVPGAEAK